MWIARDSALALRKVLGIGGVASNTILARVLDDLGIEVLRVRGARRFREMIVGNVLLLHANLDTSEDRWLKGHSIAHYSLHRGNQVSNLSRVVISKQESQAEAFAGWFFMGEGWPGSEPWELAEQHELPEWRIRRWLRLQQGEALYPPGRGR